MYFESTFSLLYCRYVTIISEGRKALSGSKDKSFRVWDLNTSAYLKQDRTRDHSEDVIEIAVSRNGARCVSGSMDGTFKIWKCDAAEECLTLRGTVHSKNIIVLSRFFTSTLWYWNFMYFLSPVYTLFTLLVPAVDKSRTSCYQGWWANRLAAYCSQKSYIVFT
jgi:WD40 repeat protein